MMMMMMKNVDDWVLAYRNVEMVGVKCRGRGKGKVGVGVRVGVKTERIGENLFIYFIHSKQHHIIFTSWGEFIYLFYSFVATSYSIYKLGRIYLFILFIR